MSTTTGPLGIPESWECPRCGRRNRGRSTCWNCATAAPAVQLLPEAQPAADPASPAVQAVDQSSPAVPSVRQPVQPAEAGDPATRHYTRGMELRSAGRRDEALAALTEAAQLGSAPAMRDAGDLLVEMGRGQEARSWLEKAAAAGDSGAMWKLAALTRDDGDVASAATWYQRSADAGLVDGYAELTRMARDAGDEAGARHWAHVGADAGQPLCMALYGSQLANSPRANSAMLQRAREYLEQAAEKGQLSAAAMAVEVNSRLGDDARSRRYARMVVDSGNREEIDRLQKNGYL